MDRKVKSFRLRVDLLEWLKEYADERCCSEVSLMEHALKSLQEDVARGVPDLPASEPRVERVAVAAAAAQGQVRPARELVDQNQQAARAPGTEGDHRGVAMTRRSCPGGPKVRFRDKQQALFAIRRIQARSERGEVPQRAYFCHACRGWHLTRSAW